MRRLSWVVLGVVAVGLAGCASTSATKTSVAPTNSTFDSDVDYEYVTIVTDQANQQGHKIVWVHPPQKKKPVQ